MDKAQEIKNREAEIEGYRPEQFTSQVWEIEGEYPLCPICDDPIDYCLGHGELG
jgi:hypothetical protein